MRLVIEAKPSVVQPGDAYVLRYSLLNPSAVSLTIGAVSVRNALAGGGVTGGSVEPRVSIGSPEEPYAAGRDQGHLELRSHHVLADDFDRGARRRERLHERAAGERD